MHVFAVQESSQLSLWGVRIDSEAQCLEFMYQSMNTNDTGLCNWSYVTACLLANKYVVCICKTHGSIRFTQQIGNVKHVLGKEQ